MGDMAEEEEDTAEATEDFTLSPLLQESISKEHLPRHSTCPRQPRRGDRGGWDQGRLHGHAINVARSGICRISAQTDRLESNSGEENIVLKICSLKK